MTETPSKTAPGRCLAVWTVILAALIAAAAAPLVMPPLFWIKVLCCALFLCAVCFLLDSEGGLRCGQAALSAAAAIVFVLLQDRADPPAQTPPQSALDLNDQIAMYYFLLCLFVAVPAVMRRRGGGKRQFFRIS